MTRLEWFRRASVTDLLEALVEDGSLLQSLHDELTCKTQRHETFVAALTQLVANLRAGEDAARTAQMQAGDPIYAAAMGHRCDVYHRAADQLATILAQQKDHAEPIRA